MTISTLPYGGSLPETWEATPLKYLAALMNGYVFNSADRTDVGTPIIRIENLNGSQNFNYSDGALPGRYRVYSGDLLFSWSGNPGTSFGPYLWAEPGEYYLNQHIFKMRVSGCDTRWLYWSLRAATHWIERELTSGMIGMVHVTKEELAAVPIPVPPVESQRRIADFLDAETARIDRLADLRRLQLLRLEERVYAAVSETLVPGILGPPRSSGPWPWLPAMASDRPLVRLGYVCRLQSGLTIDSKRDLSGDVVTRPYLRVANVQAGHVDLDSVVEVTVPRDIANRTSLRSGDVLMTEGGDLDKLGRGTVWLGELPDCLHQNHVFALRPEPDRLDGDYLALMTRTLHGRCYFESTGSKTTNLASTNSSKIMSFPIPLPGVATQRALATEVQTVIDSSQSAKRLLERQLALLAERRQALITAAVTGQFDVSSASGRNVTEGITA
ncbi:restriction endonuclease subunit S [Streptomyces lavendulae]|uniref:restriction endonuclease subunit S n=1 Tax=Streptomyces lavendulae TaxID=1914 RepID=UPI0034094CD6